MQALNVESVSIWVEPMTLEIEAGSFELKPIKKGAVETAPSPLV